jgi:polyhydroxyalkanoate synthesis regulator phasin
VKPLTAFLLRAMSTNPTDACLADIQRAIAIIDEMVDGELTAERAREMLEELSGIQARVVIEDARKR